MRKVTMIFWGVLTGLTVCAFCSGCVATRPTLSGTSVSCQYSIDKTGFDLNPCGVQQHASLSVTHQF